MTPYHARYERHRTRLYYERHRERLLAKRRLRYATDPEYRARKIQASKARYARMVKR